MQRLLDLLGIPYTGTAPFDCEVAFDKVLAKDALVRAGVRTPEWLVVEGWALRDLGAGAALSQVTDRVGLPCVVKPSRSGSALGVSFVERASDLAAAVMAALSFAGAAIVEAKVEGSEVAVGVVGTPPDAEALPLVEIVREERGVRLRRSLHGRGHRVLRTGQGSPRRSRPPARSRRCGRRAGSTCVTSRGSTRSSTRTGQPWVLEVNVSPGMTDTSLLPMAAQAAGWSLAELCERVLRSATSHAEQPP